SGEGLVGCKASASTSDVFKSKTSSKEVEDYLKTYSSVGMDVNCWKDRFLVYLDGLEPYLLEVLENGPFVPMSPLSTSTNPLTKPLNQWSPEDRKLANQDKRLKSIIISCLPNDVMKSVIKCTTAKAIWTDLILAHAIPSNIRDTKIAALRLKFNAFKALEGEKVQGTYTRLKVLLNDLENKGVSIPQAEESDSYVEEDTRNSSEFLADLNAEFHDRALLVNQKGILQEIWKGLKAEIVVLTKKIDAMSKGKSEKGLVAESFDWDEESVSSEDEKVSRVKEFMAITEDEPSIRKADARLGQWVEITMKKVQRLLSMIDGIPVTSFKLIRTEPTSTLADVLTLVDLTQTLAVSEDIKKIPKKGSTIKAPNKMTQTVSDPNPMKKDDPSTEQLLLTLMKDLKGLKEQIKIPSDTSPYNHLSEDYYVKPKCSTCGSTNHLTKEHLEQAAVKKTLAKLKAQSSQGSSSRKAPMIPKPFKDCKYYGLNDHHSDECEYYPEYLKRYSKESGPKVVFGDNSSGDTEEYGLVNYNGITFTRVAYVNGLNHNLISISQLCDANFKVLFTKTQGTIFNQNNEVMLIAPRRRDVYVIDMSSYNEESNACFFSKASNSVNWLWHKRLSHLNFKNINKLARQNLVAGLPSLTFSKDKFSLKIENLNEVRVKELRSDNGTEGISPDISYFYVFNYHVHIYNHMDHLGKFDAKADDEFLVTLQWPKHSSTKGDEINFNENRSFPNDEFIVPRNNMSQCSENDDDFPYVPCWDS
ncbi:retrovirus-related pol polyprotein from transposon TNT 1-94, partial [Tanacetum coccineum]